MPRTRFSRGPCHLASIKLYLLQWRCCVQNFLLKSFAQKQQLVLVRRSIPIYADHDDVYRADTCRPLVKAAGSTFSFRALKHGHYPGIALPDGALYGVKMVGFWNAKSDQDWGLPWHRNEGIELTFLEAGRLDFGVDGSQHQLCPDALTFTRPWQDHRIGNPCVTRSRLHWLIIDVGVRRPHQKWLWPTWVLLSRPELNELTQGLRLNERPVWKATADMRRCFQFIGRFIDSYRDGSSVSRLALKINELLLLFREMLSRKTLPADSSLINRRRTVQLFLNDLQTNPQHLSLEYTVEGMAHACDLGVTQFIHHAKCLVNMTPIQYLNHCRIEFAATLLRTRPNTSITDIALETGFSSSQYFATLFARRFGHSPREYREKFKIFH